ncbi:MAG: subclass B1 metallo-beta-lactamase [Bacteroidota bacterium]
MYPISPFRLFFLFALSLLAITCSAPVNVPTSTTSAAVQKHLFFLHNRWLEGHELDEPHPAYGRVEYEEMLSAFREAGLLVHTERRPAGTDHLAYARKIVGQIDSLLMVGVPANDITVAGTSKGGYIAQYVSTYAENRDLNFVFIGSFRASDLVDFPDINYCGNVLVISEKSDILSGSALKRKERSSCKLTNYRELELDNGLGHGFLFRASPEWIEPTIKWAKGDFEQDFVPFRSEALVVEKIAKGTYLHTSFLKTNSYGVVPCNGLLVVDGGEALVFDTPSGEPATEELIAFVEDSLGARITAVVPTHFHVDCLGTLSNFYKREIPSFAHLPTLALAEANGATVPETGFSDSLILTVGQQQVRVAYHGSGHTHDNIVAYVPSTKILFGGCLLKTLGAPKGNLADADVPAWPETIRRLRRKYQDVVQIIPGHGPMGSDSLFTYTELLFASE